MGNKFNKGEWSEFYAFMYILATGRLHAADENRNKIEDRFYNVLSTIKKDVEYKRIAESREVVFEYDSKEFSIPLTNFEDNLNNVFEAITNGNETFEIPTIESLIKQLKIDSIKERSSLKGDIQLKIQDQLVGFNPVHSFSIKSYVGGNATLLNASKGTKFTYSIVPPLSDSKIRDINGLKGKRGWLNKVIEEIYNSNVRLELKSMSSKVFEYNLQMIDYRLPEILAGVLVEGYLVTNKKISLAVESYLEKNTDEKEQILKYKINELLTASALGMVPMTEWDGRDEANGGYIIVKENSEVLCYHLYERNKLKQYLYNNTRFETPSTKRYDLGTIIKNEDGSQEISLGLQIRF